MLAFVKQPKVSVELVLSIGMTVIGIIMIYLNLSRLVPEMFPCIRLTAPSPTAQSSHPSLFATRLLEKNLKKMIGKVTAAMIITSRMISPLREGCGTPSQISF
jgi:hypothetical protein